MNKESENKAYKHRVSEIYHSSFKKGKCLYPGGCEAKKTAKSHSIQKKQNNLISIAKDGHVYSTGESIKALRDYEDHAKLGLEAIGIGKASTFPGFCSSHDTQLFLPIEGEKVSIDKFTASLFAYRSLCYELNRRAQLVKGTIDVAKFHADIGRSNLIEEDKVIDMFSIVNEKLKLWKVDYDRLYMSNRMQTNYYLVEFDRQLPFMSSCAFMPEVDIGEKRYNLAENPEFVSLNIFNQNGKSNLLMCSYGRENGEAELFVDAFSDLHNADKANALLNLTLLHSENVFISMDWWDKIPDNFKAELKRKMISGTSFDPSGDRPRDTSLYRQLVPVVDALVEGQSYVFD